MDTENKPDAESEDQAPEVEAPRKTGWITTALNSLVALATGGFLGVWLVAGGYLFQEEENALNPSRTGEWKLDYLCEEAGGAGGGTLEVRRIEYFPTYIVVETPYGGGRVFPVNRLRKFNFYRDNP